MNVPEKELVAMVLSGRTEAFEPLVLPYRDSLMALAYRITWNREDAREAAQEALFRAFKYLHRYDPCQSFRNWILRICANAACDRARKLRREREAVQEFGPELRSKDDPEAGCRAREFQSDLAACLEVLSPKEREVFVLRDIEDMNVRETARAIGGSSVSVRVHLSRARQKIRDAIRERYPHLEEKG